MNDLDELKSLLFGAEKQTLDSIAERVERRETRAADVADILPEAIDTSHRKDGELVRALKDPVGRCLHESFREQPEFYGDALYPVMGPAIRKSIMHALRTFTQQINTTMEQSLSAKGLKWRFQAWRSGVPFGEFVLQKTLLYRVEQAYLISRDNGLLIGHVHHNAAKIKDSDAVSAMFTAIQDFVKESFSPDRTGRLETADMGEFTLWAVHGPHALLVCVIRGLPPKSLRGELSGILERIHFRYGDAIRNYAGDTTSVQGVEEELGACLRFEAQQARESARRRIPLPVLILLLLLAASVIGFSVLRWFQFKDYQRFADALARTPGIYVGEIELDGYDMRVRGMRDPLADHIADVATAAGIDADRVQAELRPFQSLDPEIILRREARAPDVPAVVEPAPVSTVPTPASTAPSEWQRLQAALAELDGQQFFFSTGTTLTDRDQASLQAYAADLGALYTRAGAVGASVGVSLTGHTDGTGSSDLNASLAMRRAAVVRAALVEAGLPAAAIRETSSLPDSTDVDLGNRRVDVRVSAALDEDSPAE